jgi:hypothetical protein
MVNEPPVTFMSYGMFCGVVNNVVNPKVKVSIAVFTLFFIFVYYIFNAFFTPLHLLQLPF